MTRGAPKPRGAAGTRRLLAPLLVAAGLFAAAAIAEARPGGGHSFSSSSSSSSPSSSSYSSSSSSSSWSSSGWSSSGRSSSSGSSGGSGGRARQNFVISDDTPYWDAAIMGIFGALTLLVFAAWVARGILRARRESAAARQIGDSAAAEMMRAGGLGSALRGWSARTPPRAARTGHEQPADQRPARPRRRRPRLRELDPDFSQIAFEDLAFRLYAAAYRATTRGSDLDALAPYLTPEIRKQLRATNWKHGLVDNVVVGALVFGRVDNEGEYMTIHVRYEANVAYSGMARPYTDYLRERWTFRRRMEATTRPPEETLALGCPSCGAPFVSSDDRRCDHCDTVVDDARFNWQVYRVERRRPLPTIAGRQRNRRR